MSSQTILRIAQVKAKTGLSAPTIYRAMMAGTFPKQVAISYRAVGWLESDVNTWLDSRIELSRQRQAA
jgi:prophage regulatory protein